MLLFFPRRLLASTARRFTGAALCVLLAGASSASEVTFYTLENEQLTLELTPNYGGLVTSFARPGKSSVVVAGDAITEHPQPEVSPESDHIPYLGHTVWAGPQSEWWVHQDLNPERRDRRAQWPPDPFVALAQAEVVRSSENAVTLRTVPSPISGLQLEKVFTLAASKEGEGLANNAVDLQVTATNIRPTPVAWDIWFNTRVAPSAAVYVPVSSMNHVRVEQHTDERFGPLRHRLWQGLFTLEQAPPPTGKQGRRGKAFIQPAEGWIAAFTQEQLFVITFPHQRREVIHPEQGQVELYLSVDGEAPDHSLMELEVHGPYQQLAPGEAMSASERWYVLPYDGHNSREAHRQFLRENLPQPLRMPGQKDGD